MYYIILCFAGQGLCILYYNYDNSLTRMVLCFQTIEKLPDKVLLNIFSYLSHREICFLARVCKKWRQVAYDTRLWKDVSLRPDISGLHVGSLESLLALIRLVWRVRELNCSSPRWKCENAVPIDLSSQFLIHSNAAGHLGESEDLVGRI